MGKSFLSTFSVLSHCYAHICESRKNVEKPHGKRENISAISFSCIPETR